MPSGREGLPCERSGTAASLLSRSVGAAAHEGLWLLLCMHSQMWGYCNLFRTADAAEQNLPVPSIVEQGS